jgi:hypothetical protein
LVIEQEPTVVPVAGDSPTTPITSVPHDLEVRLRLRLRFRVRARSVFVRVNKIRVRLVKLAVVEG